MPMFIDFLRDRNIEFYGILPFSEVTVTRPYLYTRYAGFVPQSVLMLLFPYYAGETDNISRYAAGRDYHLFADAFMRDFTAVLSADYPGNAFYGFADHSPIEERTAAAKAGLGVIGRNGLLINEKYASFVFIAELLSDRAADAFGLPVRDPVIRRCVGCGACEKACPTGALRGGDLCLSALTQKKGNLTPKEKSVIRENGSAWGCDVCQTVCPYTEAARRRGTLTTPIAFFHENRRPRLSEREIREMSDEEFASRAYAWRGRDVILRNLRILEGDHSD